ncbi:hypothetical protein E1298_46880, partial [Actinomadura rubrisoli]
MSNASKIIGARLRKLREEPRDRYGRPHRSREKWAIMLRSAAGPGADGLPGVKSLADMIKQWERGDHIPGPIYRPLYARVTGKTEEELFAEAIAPHQDSAPTQPEVEPTKRRDALKLGVAAATPEAVHRVLGHAAEEAMEFTRLADVTSLGAGTLAHLDAVVVGLDHAYSKRAPGELFGVARAYRHQVAELIQGPHTLKQARELYVHAAWLSEALAWLAHDLGDPFAAEAWAVDAFQHADQAGHDELCAWATDVMASIAIYTDQPARALAAAQRGITR